MGNWMQKNLPTPGDVHIDGPLTNLSLGYMQEDQNFVASRVFPVIPVARQSDKYFTYDRGYWYRDEMKLRGPGTESAGAGFAISSATYSCALWALHHDIDDDTRGNADAGVNVDEDASDFLSQQALLRQEKAFATDFFKAGVWGTDATPATTWDDPASDPIANIETGKKTVLQNTGKEPNVLTVGYDVWQALKQHPDLVDRLKAGQTPGGNAMVTRASVAALFELDEVLVMKSSNNTANEGAANVFAFIGGKHALLTYRAPRPGLRSASAGYTFTWAGRLGANALGGSVRRFRMEQLKSDRFEIEVAFDQKAVATELGYMMDDAVA